MTINPSYAAIAAVSSTMLFFGQPTNAQGLKPTLTPSFTASQQAEALPQMQLPAGFTLPKPPQPPQPPQTPAPVAPPAPAPVQPVASAPQQPVTKVVASSSGNTYYKGQCTWYVKEKRPDLPNRLGNGGQWVANAAARGFSTGTTPRIGAVAEQPGHVAYVEAVNSNGTVTISEMNYNGAVGKVHTRTVAASTFKYIY